MESESDLLLVHERQRGNWTKGEESSWLRRTAVVKPRHCGTLTKQLACSGMMVQAWAGSRPMQPTGPATSGFTSVVLLLTAPFSLGFLAQYSSPGEGYP